MINNDEVLLSAVAGYPELAVLQQAMIKMESQ